MRKILFLCLCILILSRVAADDFGDFSGSYDYGGWSSSDSGWSSSSSDWSSSSSSGWSSSSSDWDSGYSSSSSSHSYSSHSYSSHSSSGYSSSSGGYSSSSGSSSSGKSSGSNTSSGSHSSRSGDSSFAGFLGIMLMFTVIGLGTYHNYITNKKKNQDELPRRVSTPTHRTYSPRPPGATRTNPFTLQPIIRYSDVDPNFSVETFKQRLSNIYVRLQYAWQAKDLEPVRPFLTDALFSQYDLQLNSYRRSNTTNIIEHIAVLGISITGWKQQGGEDVIIAVLRSRINDYVIDDASGRVVRGSRTAEKFMEYEYTLSRKTGMKTASTGGVRTVNCPNCGSAIDINQSAVCKYCGSTLQAAPEDWVISGIKGLSQRTVGK